MAATKSTLNRLWVCWKHRSSYLTTLGVDIVKFGLNLYTPCAIDNVLVLHIHTRYKHIMFNKYGIVILSSDTAHKY